MTARNLPECDDQTDQRARRGWSRGAISGRTRSAARSRCWIPGRRRLAPTSSPEPGPIPPLKPASSPMAAAPARSSGSASGRGARTMGRLYLGPTRTARSRVIVVPPPRSETALARRLPISYSRRASSPPRSWRARWFRTVSPARKLGCSPRAKTTPDSLRVVVEGSFGMVTSRRTKLDRSRRVLRRQAAAGRSSRSVAARSGRRFFRSAAPAVGAPVPCPVRRRNAARARPSRERTVPTGRLRTAAACS